MKQFRKKIYTDFIGELNDHQLEKQEIDYQGFFFFLTPAEIIKMRLEVCFFYFSHYFF